MRFTLSAIAVLSVFLIALGTAVASGFLRPDPSCSGDCSTYVMATKGSPPTGWSTSVECRGECSSVDPCESKSRSATHGGVMGSETFCECSSVTPGTTQGTSCCTIALWNPVDGPQTAICLAVTACPTASPTCAFTEIPYDGIEPNLPKPPKGKTYYTCICQ